MSHLPVSGRRGLSLEQDSVLITGSSKEIGAACAVGLAKRGFRVFEG